MNFVKKGRICKLTGVQPPFVYYASFRVRSEQFVYMVRRSSPNRAGLRKIRAQGETSVKLSKSSIVLLVTISIADSSMDIVREFCSKFEVRWRCEPKSEENSNYYLRREIIHVVCDPDSEGNFRY